MKLFLLAFFVAAAVAIPIPDETDGNIEVIVNGVPEGQALDLGQIVDIHAQEKVNGQVVVASNVLHPFTAQGIAEAAAAAEAEAAAAAEVDSKPDTPDSVVLPGPPAPVEEISETEAQAPAIQEPVLPEAPVIPDPVVLPGAPAPTEEISETEAEATAVQEPALPEAPEIPDHIVLPGPPASVVDKPEVPEAVELPQPEQQIGEIFNNGMVSMNVNTNEPGLLSTLKGWLDVMVNYVAGSQVVQSSQIV